MDPDSPPAAADEPHEAEIREEALSIERRRVIVHNITMEILLTDLEDCFGIFGPIADLKILRSLTHPTVACVLFEHPECAALAVQVPTANVNGFVVRLHSGMERCELCRPGQLEF